MSGKKKGGKQDTGLATIVLLTAILNLAKALIDLISKLNEQGEGALAPPPKDTFLSARCQDKYLQKGRGGMQIIDIAINVLVILADTALIVTIMRGRGK